ncbi:MAG: ring-cleaving dioxygenase [Acidobacteria bacterium]|nr:MAG: ring-cleaving dioxygenase [Acidobacteriota bacterium]
MLMQPISGIHHVTAIASDPQRNLDFYTEVLGMRLVKRTVNFDDPGTYHLYFGDEVGTPGSILTFFSWPMGARGSPGVGQVEATSFGIPENSLSYWERRLLAAGIPAERSGKRFDEEVLTFVDPDGLKLELVAHPQRAGAMRAWKEASVSAQHALRGFYSVTLCEQGYESTVEVLETMGFRKVGEQGNRFRFDVGEGGTGAWVDILCASEASYGRVAVGIVHHVAWRVVDDNSQQSWRKRLVNRHLNVTPVIDRCYFHSIYFREPGGVLFELATDPPGFAIDEPMEKLGEALKLPSWLEPSRKRIEQVLPPIQLRRPIKEA